MNWAGPPRTFSEYLKRTQFAIAIPLYTRKMRILAARGRRVPGQVLARSPFGKAGQSPTTIGYTVNGQHYQFRRDILIEEADEMESVGATVLYDPQHPARAVHLAPDIAALPLQ